MESNKNNNDNNNEGNEHEQPQRTAPKRKLNELTNDEDKPAAAEEEDRNCGSKKNREEGNDLDLESSKLETSTTTTVEDLPPSAGRHRKLPPELNCQIFYCLNVATRRKFILGLGWDFYAMFRQSLLIKSKRLCNVVGNGWRRSNGNVTISEDGLVTRHNTYGWQNVYAEKGFPISVADCRTDGFPGTICYYFEVKTLSEWCMVGLSDDIIPLYKLLAGRANGYAFVNISTNGRLEDNQYIEWPVEARPELPNGEGDVFGCGILIAPDNKLTSFFTLNGIFLGNQIPISPSVDRLFPAVSTLENFSTFEANFGDDKNKPFQYDINKCPGIGLDCI